MDTMPTNSLNTQLMTTYEQSIADTYGQPDLAKTILNAYAAAGKDIDRLTRDDLAAFDEFHIKGRDATRELARLADLTHDSQVLDVGSGVGGPARTLAAEFGCSVTGIDLVEEYCDVAAMLTERVGLDGRVTFHHENALDMTLEDAIFDVVWLQHVTMNIENKRGLFEELHRVLRPGGKLVLHEILARGTDEPYFPVPWADDPALSFLVSAEEMSQLLDATEFEVLTSRDTTEESLRWFNEKLAAKASPSPDAPPPLGLNLLMGPETPEKLKNVARNLESGRIGVMQGVMTKQKR